MQSCKGFFIFTENLKMQYSQEFIKEVKFLFPDNQTILKLVDNGDEFLGSYLDSTYGISIDEVLLATSLDELQATARLMKRKAKLYRRWCEETSRI